MLIMSEVNRVQTKVTGKIKLSFQTADHQKIQIKMNPIYGTIYCL